LLRAVGLGPLLAPLAEAAASASRSAADVAEQSAPSGSSAANSPGFWIPEGSEISLFVLIVSSAALAALLAFTVGRELRAIYRWRL